MKAYLFLFSGFFLLFSLHAQDATRQFQSIQATEEGCAISVSDGTYQLASYSEHIIEVKFIPSNGMGTYKTSHAIQIQPQKNVFKLQQIDATHYVVQRAQLEVRIQTAPFELAYYHAGKLLCKEGKGYQPGQLHSIDLAIQSDEKLMGAGARALGMNRRGYRLQLYNRAHYGYETHSELMNFTMPIFMSDRLYMVHFDNPETGYLDLDAAKNNHVRFEAIGGRMCYQIIAGQDWKEITTEWTYLSGRQPMPPRWAFGNFASRFGYHSEAEAREVVQTFRTEQIPLDAIIFDLYWFGKTIQGTLGNLSFYRDSFPDPKQMMSDFKQNGVKTVLITEPFILNTSKNWQITDSLGLLGTNAAGKSLTYDFYFGHTGLLDIYKPETKKWFWQVYKDLHDMGASGIWGDLGEPEVHPADMKHKDAWANQVHNIYGHDWARLISEGYQKDFARERPFILMRAGYSGSQRYGMIPWSGDVNRTWGGLKPQMEISLQMGLQGMAYMHSDLGGFAGANDEPELYVRWLQYGVFQPIFRPHAQEDVPSEAIYKDAQTKALAKKAIESRYRMLPYNYTLAYQNATKGWPLMRPIYMEFPKADWSFEQSETYMWGAAFLVHAITDPISGFKENTVRTKLPAGTPWFDFSSGQLIEKTVNSGTDSQFIEVETPLSLDQIPVFVRAGSFVPMATVCQATDAYKDTTVTVHYYHHPTVTQATGEWYEDDGLSAGAWLMFRYKRLQFTAKADAKTLEINAVSTFGQRLSAKQFTYQVQIHCATAPKKVKLNGKSCATQYDASQQVLILTAPIKHSETQFSHTILVTW
ncbi:MAG: DUF4968 domain-containing protein [Crocinitomicaceae bacterium]|jgi:oligosaccharide 4-alpha-D-glucosyltransferase|nr:DUF4968 domain-containing protein [Crocinitomicaceae bacterium]MDP4724058.1 DUF4968 domain-containing protein [Crocinitomicaceae bacterium]MDP4799551.1 DUF4968 domain-containing protein [Crocinitomicaceae bacterium]MDP4868477.1 DUF4968 domain-containing protein [Crocinitomicaceae bacterium]MDP4955481.1 DUF4968 domain-containing protein [Crocinitomicaceae bacterium]